MSILWRGGEDIDFSTAVGTTTTAGRFRSGYARCAVNALDGKSAAFAGGAVTSAWLASYIYRQQTQTSRRIVGLIKSSTTNSGLWVGSNSAAAGKLTLYKYDGSTLTALASEGGTSLAADGDTARLDVQLVNFGASATVNVFIDGVQIITYSGDVTVSGVASVDAVGLGGSDGVNDVYWNSEIIVADEDTRTFSLVTMAPSSDGTTTDWPTGAYSDVDEVTINDADVNSTDTASQDQQFNVGDLPSGYFSIKDVTVKARASRTADATATKLALGINSGGTVNVGTAADPGTSWTTLERAIGATNPVTTAAWTLSEMNALQLDLQSGS